MNPRYATEAGQVFVGNALRTLATLPTSAVDCIVTSPPYWGLRDYGHPDRYGAEPTLERYIQNLQNTFTEARRVLADDGTLWLNLGDRYAANSDGWRRGLGYGRQPLIRPAASLPPKNLIGVPWRVALALQDNGWILRNAITWHKPNAASRPVADRFSCRYEMVFMLVKQRRYYFDVHLTLEHTHPGPGLHTAYADPVANESDTPNSQPDDAHTGSEDGAQSGTTASKRRDVGDVWTIPTRPHPASSAGFPIEVPMRAIAAGCRPGGTVLDPFAGTGTALLAARSLGRFAIGIELQPQLADLMIERLEWARRKGVG